MANRSSDVAQSTGWEHREADRAVPAEVPVKHLFETPGRTPRAGTFRPGGSEVADYLPTPPFCVGVAGEHLAQGAETRGRSRQPLFGPLELDHRLEQGEPAVKYVLGNPALDFHASEKPGAVQFEIFPVPLHLLRGKDLFRLGGGR
jgi:hypothetical protein